MSQNIAGLEDTPDVNTRLAKEPGDSRCSNGLVTVTFTPDTYLDQAAERVRQLFPDAQQIIEKSTRTGLDGEEYESEVQRYRCTYPTIAEARKAFRSVGSLASFIVEAPITLRAEEFEVLAQFHAQEAIAADWMMALRYGAGDRASLCYHDERLKALASVLGLELVHEIFYETSEKMSRHHAWALKYKTQAESETSLKRSRFPRVSSSKQLASGRKERARVRRAANGRRPRNAGK